jgi:hypothetical protein
MRHLHLCGPAALAIVLATVVVRGDVALSEAHADSCARKFQTINQNSLVDARAPRVTSLTEAEVNSYLKYRAGSQIPVGVVDPYISIEEVGRLAGRATVDLDAVREDHESTGWFDPMNLLTGQLPMTATAVLTTTNGIGRLTIESVTVGGVPVPTSLLQAMVSHYTRSPERPEGFDLNDPFELPMGIRTITVESAEAVVVQ